MAEFDPFTASEDQLRQQLAQYVQPQQQTQPNIVVLHVNAADGTIGAQYPQAPYAQHQQVQPYRQHPGQQFGQELAVSRPTNDPVHIGHIRVVETGKSRNKTVAWGVAALLGLGGAGIAGYAKFGPGMPDGMSFASSKDHATIPATSEPLDPGPSSVASTTVPAKANKAFKPAALGGGSNTCVGVKKIGFAATADVLAKINFLDGTQGVAGKKVLDANGVQKKDANGQLMFEFTHMKVADDAAAINVCVPTKAITANGNLITVDLAPATMNLKLSDPTAANKKTRLENLTIIPIAPAANGIKYPFSEPERKRVDAVLSAPSTSVIARNQTLAAFENVLPAECNLDLAALAKASIKAAIVKQVKTAKVSGLSIAFTGSVPTQDNKNKAANPIALDTLKKTPANQMTSTNFVVRPTAVTCEVQ